MNALSFFLRGGARCPQRACPGLRFFVVLATAFFAPLAFATPTIVITSPANGSTQAMTTSPGGITITTTTTPTASSSIVSTQFFDNGISIGTRGGNNPSIVWTPTSAGTHTITATVTDNSVPTTGTTPSLNTATATSIVSLTTVRTASVLAPVEGTTLAQDSQIFFRASATMSDLIIRDVEFLVDGFSIPSTQTDPTKTIATQTPYTAAVTLSAANGFTAGAHVVTARVTATDGTTTATSIGININVAAKIGNSPTVTVTAPAGGANVAVGTATTITATASDGDGFIPSTTGGGVTFFVDGEPIGTDLTAPYSIAWTPATAKQYSIVAQTVDDKANYVLSSAVTVTAVPLTTASVTLTSPTVGTIASIGSTVTLTANPTASTGATVSAVEFLVGTTVVASATSAPYSRTWTPTTAGAQSVTARVTDSAGNTATSSAVSVTVSAAPTVSISAPAASSTLPAGTPVTVSANATVGVGLSVTLVEFFANGSSIGSDNTSPFSISWTPSTSGTTSLTARITDSAGAVVTSSGVNVTVTGAAASATLTAPTVGRIVSIGAPVSLAANATASPGGTVVVVEFLVGSSVVASTTTSPYTATWTPTAAGAQSLTARVTDSNGSQVTSSAVAITVAAAPTVSITSPAASASVPTGAVTTITANATVGTGLSIASVEFFANGASLGSDTTAPYTFAWTPSVLGATALTARVTDSAGAVVTSSTVNVTVTAASSAPTVSLTSPTTGSVVTIGSNVSVSADATPPGGATIAQVQFLVGATIIGTDTTAPYSVNWVPTTAGNNSLTARALDSLGNSTTSAAISVTATTATAVSITAPANNSSASVGTAVTVTASPTASLGNTITQVTFFANGTQIGAPVTTAPFSVAWTPAAVGTAVLTAQALDSAGGSATTTTGINVTVGNSLPSGTITAPATGSIATVGTPVTLSANALPGSNATVAQVQFLSGATVLGTATSAPYNVQWTPTTAGNTSITARILDSNNNTFTTPAITVTVNAVAGVSATITSPATGSIVPVNSPVTLTATATASPGATIAQVQFLSGATVLGTDITAPYSISWIPTTAANNSITARVLDSNNNTATSPAITITSIALPTISVTAPTNNSTLNLGANTTLTANATASAGSTVTQVEFLVGSTVVGTAFAPPYSVTWQPTTLGSTAITARVTDSAALTNTSAAINVTVNSGPPTISLTSPAVGSIITVGTPVQLAANPAPASGATIAQVQFLVGSTVIATLSGPPYLTTWTPTATGNQSLTARVTDSTGDVVTSSAVPVTVVGLSNSGVTLAISPAGSTLTGGSHRYLTATVAAGFSVDEVRFFYDGAYIGNDRQEPYVLSFQVPNGAGAHTLEAAVIETSGAITRSNVLNVTVNPATSAPLVAINTPPAGAFLPGGVTTVISGVAFDDGAVNSVTVYANGVALGNATLAGTNWSLAWTPVVTGVYSLTAIALDNSANSTLAPVVNVNVTDATSPQIAMSLSPGGTTLPAGATRNILVTAIPATGRAIVRVEFFVDGAKVGEDTTAPYTYRYVAPTTTGTHVLSARATDNADLARDVSTTLSVINVVGAPPTATLVAPTNNSTVVPGTAVSLAGTAVASGGTIASVQFYQNGTPIGNPITAAPFTASFTPPLPGSYVLDMIATDDRGNTKVSNSVTINAAFGTPTVAITSPSPNSTARATPNVPLAVNSSVTAGTGSNIVLVEFLVDGVPLLNRTTPTTGSNVSGTYLFSWTPDTSLLGLHAITIRATDTNSQSITSNPLNVNVATIVGTPPSISQVSPANNATLQSLSVVNFQATATFATINSPANNVEFYLNDASIGTATKQQASNVYRLAYDLSRLDLNSLTPVLDANGNPRYTVPFYIIARDANGNQTVTATSTLNIVPASSFPPTVQLAALLPGNQTVTAGTLFAIGVNALDSDGIVNTVQLFANGTQVAAQTNPQPGAIILFTPQTAGVFNLYALATDDTGNTAISNQVQLTVTGNTAPIVTLIRPTDDSTVTTVNTPVFLEATASDADIGQGLTVQFMNANTTVVATGLRVGTSDVYRAIWTPTQANTYSITARATDSTNAQTTTTVSRRVVVNNVSGIAPVISISVPGSTTTASTVNLTATASDSDGSVIGVEFFINRISAGQATRDQLTNTWRLTQSFAGVPVGTAEVVALARDSSGNVAASPTTNMTVNAAQSIAPNIAINASSTNVAFSRQVQLTANARDTDGNVTAVQYFANGASIGTSGNSGTNYQVNWTPTQSGTFSVYAVATDSAVNGITNTTVSAPITVTVRRNNPVLDDSAFILQTYSDVANTTNILAATLADLDDQLARGTLTRAQLVTNLTAEPGFDAPVQLLSAYYVIMGEWPTPANYTTLLATARGSVANAVGSILSSQRYAFKFNGGNVTSTAALQTSFNSSFSTLTTFANRLWQNAGLPTPTQTQVVQFQNNPTAVTAPPIGPIGRGYVPAGLNAAITEFVTITNQNNTALRRKAQAAALYYQLDRPPTPVGVTNDALIVDPIGVRIDELLRLGDLTAIADAVLKDTLYTNRYVTILKHPESLIVAPRSGAIFRVEAIGAQPLSYQWLLNGAPIPNATTPVLSLTNVDTTRVGTYTVVVTSAQNTATSDPATLTLSSTATRLANISTRGVTTGGANVLIGGFVVTGTGNQTRQMLIRVVGPTLGQAGVTGFLPNPRLELYNSTSATPIQQNDDWGNQTGGAAAVQAIQQATTRAGAFNLPNNSTDAVILATLTPGNYTVQAKGPVANPGASGVVLIEVYDVTVGAAAGPKAANVSTRGEVGTGGNILIAGFVVNGGVSRRMLIRGVGPTLRNFGIGQNALLADPAITLVDQATNRTIATNDDWATGDDAAIIASAATAAGAFPLANGSKDSAMIVMLPPGAYTVQLRGVNNTTGIGIVEVYDVDP